MRDARSHPRRSCWAACAVVRAGIAKASSIGVAHVLVLAIVAGAGSGCRRLLTQDKLETFRAGRTAAIVWEIENRQAGPDLMREAAVRILEAAGHRMVDPSKASPDLTVRITLRGSHTYDAPKPNDYWMSGEISLLGARGKIYEKHFYGDTVDLPAAFYAEDSFYESFLLMISRIHGARVAESEARARHPDGRAAGAARRVLERIAEERDRG